MAPESVERKLALTTRALREMRTAQLAQNLDNFEYHFGAFLATARSATEFLRKDAASHAAGPWWTTVEDDPDIATVIGLRNSDIHDGVLTLNRGYLMELSDDLSFNRLPWSQRARKWFEQNIPWLMAPFTKPPAPAVPFFIVSPLRLSSSFMVVPRTGLDHRNKAKVLAHLNGRSLVSIGEAFIANVRQAIVEGESNQWLIT